jgi:hypothetical protein
MRVGQVCLCDAKQQKIKAATSSRRVGRLKEVYCTVGPENSTFVVVYTDGDDYSWKTVYVSLTHSVS